MLNFGRPTSAFDILTDQSNCRTTQTPLWRRSPTGETVCNACGLYIKARNQQRPVNLKRNTPSQPSVTVQQSSTPSAAANQDASPGNLASSSRVATYVAADQMAVGATALVVSKGAMVALLSTTAFPRPPSLLCNKQMLHRSLQMA
jgi:uncharacterized Zn finger protein (UPF0148 family)